MAQNRINEDDQKDVVIEETEVEKLKKQLED